MEQQLTFMPLMTDEKGEKNHHQDPNHHKTDNENLREVNNKIMSEHNYYIFFDPIHYYYSSYSRTIPNVFTVQLTLKKLRVCLY